MEAEWMTEWYGMVDSISDAIHTQKLKTLNVKNGDFQHFSKLSMYLYIHQSGIVTFCSVLSIWWRQWVKLVGLKIARKTTHTHTTLLIVRYLTVYLSYFILFFALNLINVRADYDQLSYQSNCNRCYIEIDLLDIKSINYRAIQHNT